jgi:hypothetical protein
LAQYGDKLFRDRPDPNVPGGLGAEESGFERTGPTQDSLIAIWQGGRWAEVGRYYDSANDPVTAWKRHRIVSPLDNGNWQSGQSSIPASAPLAAEAGRRNHVADGMIPTRRAALAQSGLGFSEQDHARADKEMCHEFDVGGNRSK